MTIAILINGEAVFECENQQDLDEQKAAFLDKMDSDMARGIKIHGQHIPEPDKQQRAEFVCLNLVKALQQDNQAIISVSCAWLQHRYPNLQEVQLTDSDDGININLLDESE